MCLGREKTCLLLRAQVRDAALCSSPLNKLTLSPFCETGRLAGSAKKQGFMVHVFAGPFQLGIYEGITSGPFLNVGLWKGLLLPYCCRW